MAAVLGLAACLKAKELVLQAVAGSVLCETHNVIANQQIFGSKICLADLKSPLYLFQRIKCWLFFFLPVLKYLHVHDPFALLLLATDAKERQHWVSRLQICTQHHTEAIGKVLYDSYFPGQK